MEHHSNIVPWQRSVSPAPSSSSMLIHARLDMADLSES